MLPVRRGATRDEMARDARGVADDASRDEVASGRRGDEKSLARQEKKSLHPHLDPLQFLAEKKIAGEAMALTSPANGKT